MIRIYEGFLKPETCALPTKIVNQNQNQDDQPLMVNIEAIFPNHSTAMWSTLPRCAVIG